ncbi:MAG: hypothetical protein M3460_25940 [Actinomycetota bacterium]|nr:hypothetical protein [Actinomycetota bacterium]
MSLQTLERRIAALEARLADIEGGYGETIYKLHRMSIKTSLDVIKIVNHRGLGPATEADVDNVLDES